MTHIWTIQPSKQISSTTLSKHTCKHDLEITSLSNDLCFVLCFIYWTTIVCTLRKHTNVGYTYTQAFVKPTYSGSHVNILFRRQQDDFWGRYFMIGIMCSFSMLGSCSQMHSWLIVSVHLHRQILLTFIYIYIHQNKTTWTKRHEPFIWPIVRLITGETWT